MTTRLEWLILLGSIRGSIAPAIAAKIRATTLKELRKSRPLTWAEVKPLIVSLEQSYQPIIEVEIR